MKYIYYNNKLRCRIKKESLFIGQVELQLQKRVFIFWVDCFKWMNYEERSPSAYGKNPMTLCFQFGNELEVWDEGTMTIPKRVAMLFDDYFKHIDMKLKWQKKFELI